MRLEYLDIPEKKINQLRKKGFESLEDLAAFYPRRYNDFRTIVPIGEVGDHLGELVSVIGTFSSKDIYSGQKVLRVRVSDNTGTLPVVWFNQFYIERTLQPGRQYVFCGKIQLDNIGQPSMPVPVFFSSNPLEFRRIAPVYRKIPGMAADYLSGCIQAAIGHLLLEDKLVDSIPQDTCQRLGIPVYKTFVQQVHAPQNDKDMADIARRKAVDALYPFCLELESRRRAFVAKSDKKAVFSEATEAFISRLPFKLTDDQDKAVKLLLSQMREGRRVEGLIQGDVGCGKTIVAIILAMLMAENGFQTAVMCPTTVLAEQHFLEFSERLSGIGVALLSSGMKAKERRETLAAISSGKIKVVVGTHAVISSEVVFKDLGLTVVDEEHRFGVEQRNLLREKAKSGIHNISMSATPIPRTLALTIYGESTEVINIHSMPEGRKPVQTILYSNEEKVYQSMYNQIKEGRQCYVVCPLIEDSDNETMANVDSVETTLKKIESFFSQYPDVKADILTGSMKPGEVNDKLAEFVAGKTDILISTTIVEVGVNVPNATVMLIKNAERFGLAQLHQLRGRVGRSDMQSYCVLLSNKKDNPRLQAMVETNDGFVIAQKDLELRGTGDLVGSKQSGLDECVTLMLTQPELYEAVRREAAAALG